MIFENPCPRDSLFLLLTVSVASSTILAVSKLSTSPTIAIEIEYGKTISRVSNVYGTVGIINSGSVRLISPRSPTVLISARNIIYTLVKITIVNNVAGIFLMILGVLYIINKVQNSYMY